jgi:hypothetical protein
MNIYKLEPSQGGTSTKQVLYCFDMQQCSIIQGKYLPKFTELNIYCIKLVLETQQTFSRERK